jgi:intracellular sulfur oxidation DsrE/DsrF family protein
MQAIYSLDAQASKDAHEALMNLTSLLAVPETQEVEVRASRFQR